MEMLVVLKVRILVSQGRSHAARLGDLLHFDHLGLDLSNTESSWHAFMGSLLMLWLLLDSIRAASGLGSNGRLHSLVRRFRFSHLLERT